MGIGACENGSFLDYQQELLAVHHGPRNDLPRVIRRQGVLGTTHVSSLVAC
jgi:hypothetical protein